MTVTVCNSTANGIYVRMGRKNVSAFIKKNLKRFDVIIGMYHDQVLTPIKTLFEQEAINITLGIPFIRISPNHGVGSDIVGKNQADPTSLIECLQFFKNLK